MRNQSEGFLVYQVARDDTAHASEECWSQNNDPKGFEKGLGRLELTYYSKTVFYSPKCICILCGIL